jgi:hypothetical protein
LWKAFNNRRITHVPQGSIVSVTEKKNAMALSSSATATIAINSFEVEGKEDFPDTHMCFVSSPYLEKATLKFPLMS